MLEVHIEWLHHSISQGQHRSWGQSGSCQRSGSRRYMRGWGHLGSCRRPQPAGAQTQTLPVEVCAGGAAKWWVDSPSPMQPRRCVIFEDSRDTEVKQTSPSTTPDKWSLEAAGSRLQSWTEEPKDLGHPPELDPCMQEFLSGTGSSGGDRDESDQSLTPEPSFDDLWEWVRWHAHWVETLAWWPELQKVPTPRSPIDFAKRVWASFQLHKVKYLAREKKTSIPCHPHPTV